MNYRQVHLDFHTSEKIANIGEKFNKEQFQMALKTGHVNSVTLFSKCHHGWAYHPSAANEIHPGLNFDLLKAQIDAAHEIGVKTPVYLSAGLDEKMARRNPQWLVRNIDESTTWVKSFNEPGYHKLCMNSPYLEYLTNQIEEVCKNYDADGIFLDIVGRQPCYCQKCIADRLALGMDPYDENAVNAHAEIVYKHYAEATREAVDKYKKGLPLFHNSGHIPQGRRDLVNYNSHLEIESLPTGGWGYDHFPFSVRYCQNIGPDCIGMTGKFHGTWGEFGGFKHPNALRYEVALAAANGAGCSIGDQLLPNGKMDMVTYNMIGKAYSELEEKEEWLCDVESVADIAVFSPDAYLGNFGTGQSSEINMASSGVCRIMLEGKYTFDVVDYESELDKYKILILPDIIRIDEKLEKKLKAFCNNGGKLLATGKSGLRENEDVFAFDFGAEWDRENLYTPDYFRPVEKIEGMGDTGYVMYAKGEKINCIGIELGIRENPYFNRTKEHFSSHLHTPNSEEYGGAGITEGKNGIYIAWEIFNSYADRGCLWYKQMLMFAVDRLLGDNKTLITDLPAQGVVTMMKQQERYVCHMLYASPVKRGTGIEIIEDIIPIYNTNLSVKPDKKISNVYLAPQKKSIPFSYENGYITVNIKKIDCHQMIVFE